MKMNLKTALIILSAVTLILVLIPLLISTLFLTTDQSGDISAPSVENHNEQSRDHGDSGTDDHEDSDGVELSAASMLAAGIVVKPATSRSIEGEVDAPGEVKLNAYLSSSITPRISAQVIQRHARLGDVVQRGQSLVTLSSVEMADAISALLVDHKEWMRVKELGASIVSARRLNEAKISYEQAFNLVQAYGMEEADINGILDTGAAQKLGEFDLAAPQKGTVTSDDFIVGELIEPGRELFIVVNESVLWVESSLAPDIAGEIEIGATARVKSHDGGWLPAKVVQKHHRLDEETRTIGIRLEVNNKEDLLHPGTFVDTRINAGLAHQHIAVPTAAILKSPDGDWIVFIEEDAGHFKPQEIEVVRTAGELSIITGLEQGTPIVVEGAFFVQSELLKSGFEVHDH